MTFPAWRAMISMPSGCCVRSKALARSWSPRLSASTMTTPGCCSIRSWPASMHRSRSDGKKVKLGLDRKFADGGTHGVAPVGYLNIREMVNGKEVRSIATDPERVELVQDGFEAFATGEYSITTLCEMLQQIGLTTRPTPKRPAKPLSRNGGYK